LMHATAAEAEDIQNGLGSQRYGSSDIVLLNTTHLP
jgi:hypothetical protein